MLLIFIPWEKSDDYIRSGHGDKSNYDSESFRTMDISKDEGIKAVVGCPKGHFKNGRCETGMEVESYLFSLDEGWTMQKAKEWFKKHEKE